MGSELYRMVRDGAPPEWTLAMRMVAWVIADDARDPSQGLPEDGGWPWSVVEMSRYRDSKGEWRDGLTERTGLSAHTVRHALAGLGKADYEMREQVTADRLGRPVFACRGHAVRYRVPPLKPRESPADPVDLTAAEGPPNRVTKGDGKVRRSGRKGAQIKSQRSAGKADPVSPGLPIVSPASQSPVVNSYLEGVRDGQGDDDDSKTSQTDPRTILDGLPELDGHDDLKTFIAAKLTATTDDPSADLLETIGKGDHEVARFLARFRRQYRARLAAQADNPFEAERRRQQDGITQWMHEHPESTP